MDSADEEEERQCVRDWEEALEAERLEPLPEYGYESFVSRSTGRYRKWKRWADVEIITLPAGNCVSVMNGRWPKTKKHRMDSVAEEAVGKICPPNKDPLDYFLYVLRQRDIKRKELKAIKRACRGW